jgi:hypothetical protein
MRSRLALLALAAGALALPAHAQVTLDLAPAADNSLYEPIQGQPIASNGSGDHLFCGVTGTGFKRRAVLRFDTSAIPPGSTVTDASVTLHMSLTIAPPQILSLHRLTASWGEGASDAPRNEGAGIDAEPGDATWLHRFFPDTFWTTPGGDFVPTPSAQKSVAEVGFYTWGPSNDLAADVQAWVNDPASNHGLILIGNESEPVTAKRFDSREIPSPTFRPVLSVTFLPPQACDPDVNQDGNVDQDDVAYLINVVGGGPNPTGIDPDFNQDGNVDQDDIAALINTVGGGGCP